MFDFTKLHLIKGKERDSKPFSFVGIIKNTSNNNLEFWLPHGFDLFPEDSYVDLKNLFFLLYKILKKFDSDKSKNFRDGKESGNNNESFKLNYQDNRDVIFYSKISMLDNIIDSFDELSIYSIINNSKKTEDIDLSKIDKYMDKCIYLKGDLMYIESMYIPKKLINNYPTNLIEMFCYVYFEIKKELNEDKSIKNEISYLANSFRDRYLKSKNSLFDEENFQETIIILKNLLSDINKKTLYKSPNYWVFYDALENFLYGDMDFSGDIFWGISDFSSVWEEMCLSYIFVKKKEKNLFYNEKILYADSFTYKNQYIGNHPVYIEKSFENPFYLHDLKSGLKRYYRPDCVLLKENNYKEFIEAKYLKDIYGLKVTKVSATSLVDIKLSLDKTKAKKHKISFMLFVSRLQSSISISPKKDSMSDYTFKDYPYEIFEKVKNDEINIIAKKIKLDCSNEVDVIDFKYLPSIFFTSPKISKKVEFDIRKQLVYELSLNLLFFNTKITSIFHIPFYSLINNCLYELIDQDLLNIKIVDKGIEIYNTNFIMIGKKYLENEI